MNSLLTENFFKKGLVYICLPTLLVLLFYWEVLGAYFDLIDVQHVLLPSEDGLLWGPGEETWRPLQYVLYCLIYKGFGRDPLPYRLLSFIAYIGTLLLFYHLHNLLLGNKTLSKIAVLLFASFYLNNQSVTQVVNQRDLLLALFGLATLVCFIHYRKAQSLRYYALALLSAVLAASSKETAIFILPPLLLAVDYYISHGIFPPRVPSLTEARRSLLPHLPFWLIVVVPLILICMRPDVPFTNYIKTDQPIPFSKYFWNTYSFIVYSFSPCFVVTSRPTLILALSIIAGLGWLFYRSTPQRRALIITLMTCTGFSFFPYILVGVIPRYMTFPATFSMFLVSLLALETGFFLHRLLEKRFHGYPLSPDFTAASLALLLLLPPIYLNYKFIKQYNKNVVYAGRLLRETLEGTIKILPLKSSESQIIYINLPCAVLSNLPPQFTNVLSTQINPCRAILKLYYRSRNISTPDLNKIKAFFVDLGYRYVRLPSGTWYTLPREWYWLTPKLSTEEYNALSKDENNKLLFFSPISYKLEDVSGRSYQELKENLAPYKDKLDYVPPFEWP